MTAPSAPRPNSAIPSDYKGEWTVYKRQMSNLQGRPLIHHGKQLYLDESCRAISRLSGGQRVLGCLSLSPAPSNNY